MTSNKKGRVVLGRLRNWKNELFKKFSRRRDGDEGLPESPVGQPNSAEVLGSLHKSGKKAAIQSSEHSLESMEVSTEELDEVSDFFKKSWAAPVDKKNAKPDFKLSVRDLDTVQVSSQLNSDFARDRIKLRHSGKRPNHRRRTNAAPTTNQSFDEAEEVTTPPILVVEPEPAQDRRKEEKPERTLDEPSQRAKKESPRKISDLKLSQEMLADVKLKKNLSSPTKEVIDFDLIESRPTKPVPQKRNLKEPKIKPIDTFEPEVIKEGKGKRRSEDKMETSPIEEIEHSKEIKGKRRSDDTVDTDKMDPSLRLSSSPQNNTSLKSQNLPSVHENLESDVKASKSIPSKSEKLDSTVHTVVSPTASVEKQARRVTRTESAPAKKSHKLDRDSRKREEDLEKDFVQEVGDVSPKKREEPLGSSQPQLDIIETNKENRKSEGKSSNIIIGTNEQTKDVKVKRDTVLPVNDENNELSSSEQKLPVTRIRSREEKQTIRPPVVIMRRAAGQRTETDSSRRQTVGSVIAPSADRPPSQRLSSHEPAEAITPQVSNEFSELFNKFNKRQASTLRKKLENDASQHEDVRNVISTRKKMDNDNEEKIGNERQPPEGSEALPSKIEPAKPKDVPKTIPIAKPRDFVIKTSQPIPIKSALPKGDAKGSISPTVELSPKKEFEVPKKSLGNPLIAKSTVDPPVKTAEFRQGFSRTRDFLDRQKEQQSVVAINRSAKPEDKIVPLPVTKPFKAEEKVQKTDQPSSPIEASKDELVSPKKHVVRSSSTRAEPGRLNMPTGLDADGEPQWKKLAKLKTSHWEEGNRSLVTASGDGAETKPTTDNGATESVLRRPIVETKAITAASANRGSKKKKVPTATLR